jgi:hypothetical protein
MYSKKLQEMSYASALAEIPEGPSYLARRRINRSVKCSRCGHTKFNASVDDQGEPIWVCLGCYNTHPRNRRNKGEKNEATKLV